MSEKNAACILVADIASSYAFSALCQKKLKSAFSVDEIVFSANPEFDSPEISAVRGAWIDALEKKIKNLTEHGQTCHVIAIGAGALVALNACMHARPDKLCLINTPLIGVSTMKEQWQIFKARGKNPETAILLSEKRLLCLESADVVREVSSPTLIIQTETTANQHIESSNFLMNQLGTGQWMVDKSFFVLPKKKKEEVSEKDFSSMIKQISDFFAS